MLDPPVLYFPPPGSGGAFGLLIAGLQVWHFAVPHLAPSFAMRGGFLLVGTIGYQLAKKIMNRGPVEPEPEAYRINH